MRFKKSKQWWAIVLLSVFSFNLVLFTVPQKASAAVQETARSQTIDGKVLDHQLYYFLVSCFVNNNMDKVTADEVNNWEWFKGQEMSAVRGAMYENETAKCSDGSFIEEAFSRFGLTKPFDAFCKLDFTYSKENGGESSAGDDQKCLDGQFIGDFDGADKGDWSSFQKSSIIELLNSTPKGKTAAGSLTNAEEYIRKYRTLMEGCSIKLVREITSGDPAANNDKLFEIPVVTQTGEIKRMLGSATGDATDGTQVYLVATTGKYTFTPSTGPGTVSTSLSLPAQTITCGQLATDLRANSNRLPKAYAAYVKANQDDKYTTGTSSGSNVVAEKSCESNGGALSWIVCGLLRLMDGMIGTLDNQIHNLLFVDKDYYSTDNLGSTWSAMRNIAYLILIPMMLLMVIGTALGFGPFDAYTVKKSLPRMLIAVIFISLSLPITQLGIIVSNNVGNGMANFISTVTPADKRVTSLSNIIADDSSGGTDTGIGFATLAAGIAGAAVGLTLFSFAAVAAVGLLIGFVILVMRQVLLVTLVVLAPLAILVWIFPGNDKLWVIWKTTFIAMLMMYPLIAILVASGKFVAGIAG